MHHCICVCIHCFALLYSPHILECGLQKPGGERKKKLANYYKNINVSNVLAVLTLCEKCVCARARHSCHIFIECALCADFNYFQCCFKSQCHCWCFKQGMLQYVCMPVWPLKLHQSSFLHNYYC